MKNQTEKTILSSDERRQLKKEAHELKPVVMVGKLGFTESLIREIDQALLTHGLIKIQVQKQHKLNLLPMIEEVVMKTQAEYIETIGNVVILYRPKHIEDTL
jgi:RNA-binding protein